MDLVVLSGPVGAGRSTLAEQLVRHHGARFVLETVDTRPELDALREVFPGRLLHVHPRAPEEGHREPGAYPSALEREADLVLDTGRLTSEDLCLQVASALGLFGRSVERLVDVLVGGQYGGEGKGQIAAHLAPEYGVLIRTGGPRCLSSGTRTAPHAWFVLGARAPWPQLPRAWRPRWPAGSCAPRRGPRSSSPVRWRRSAPSCGPRTRCSTRPSRVPEAELLQSERAASGSGPRRVGEFDWALLWRSPSPRLHALPLAGMSTGRAG